MFNIKKYNIFGIIKHLSFMYRKCYKSPLFKFCYWFIDLSYAKRWNSVVYCAIIVVLLICLNCFAESIKQ